MMFDLVSQYHSLGTFLSVIIIISLFLYFITSSDSGSLVDTIVAANGIDEPCIGQRVWWSLTEGLSATGLMYSSMFDVSDARATMKALQAASIAAGLPYTALVCFMCVSLWKALQYEFEEDSVGVGFRSSCLDFGVTLYQGLPGDRCFNFGGPKINFNRLKRFFKNLICPFIDMKAAMEKIAIQKRGHAGAYETIVPIFAGVVLYYAGFILLCLDWLPIEEGGHIMRGKPLLTADGYVDHIVDKPISNRYGYFRMYTNDWVDGSVVTQATMPGYAADYKESMALGDRVGASNHFSVIGWFLILFFGGIVYVIRANVRELLKIRGSQIDDMLCGFCLWPTVLIQLNEALDDGAIQAEEKLPMKSKEGGDGGGGDAQLQDKCDNLERKIGDLVSRNARMENEVASLKGKMDLNV
jgi:hypothetical protein